MNREKKWIQIWYSWGDQESPTEVPDDMDAWDYAKLLVVNEVFISQEEQPYGCSVYTYPDEGRVELKYHQDDEWCYYLITDKEEYDPWQRQ